MVAKQIKTKRDQNLERLWWPPLPQGMGHRLTRDGPVREVSAMFVATMHLRCPSFVRSKIRAGGQRTVGTQHPLTPWAHTHHPLGRRNYHSYQNVSRSARFASVGQIASGPMGPIALWAGHHKQEIRKGKNTMIVWPLE